MTDASTAASKRFSYQKTANGLGIEIPANLNYFTLLFLSFWLILWTRGAIMTGSNLFFSGLPISENLFQLLWMIIWSVSWLGAILMILWQLFGYEMIFITAGSLVIEKRLFFLISRKIFAIDQISDMKINKLSRSQKQKSSIGESSVSFNFDGKTIHFALDLGLADIYGLLEILKKDMPTVFKTHYKE